MIAHGTFETSTSNAPPYDSFEGVAFSRSTWQRVFAGDLVGTGSMEMLSARTPRPGSAGYVALERVSGELHGRRGSFALLHTAVMGPAGRSLVIQVVPGSGTGELSGIAGKMDVTVRDGVRFYTLDYTLEQP
jgi:hypothetical protein